MTPEDAGRRFFCQTFQKICIEKILSGAPTRSANGHKSVADQDFPEGAPTPEGGMKTKYFAKICQKLHENDRNWTPLRSVTISVHHSL